MGKKKDSGKEAMMRESRYLKSKGMKQTLDGPKEQKEEKKDPKKSVGIAKEHNVKSQYHKAGSKPFGKKMKK